MKAACARMPAGPGLSGRAAASEGAGRRARPTPLNCDPCRWPFHVSRSLQRRGLAPSAAGKVSPAWLTGYYERGPERQWRVRPFRGNRGNSGDTQIPGTQIPGKFRANSGDTILNYLRNSGEFRRIPGNSGDTILNYLPRPNHNRLPHDPPRRARLTPSPPTPETSRPSPSPPPPPPRRRRAASKRAAPCSRGRVRGLRGRSTCRRISRAAARRLP